jgi:hypothetical protein
MPKVTFIIDGKEQTVEFEHGKLEYKEHGLPESFLDVAMNPEPLLIRLRQGPRTTFISSSAREWKT